VDAHQFCDRIVRGSYKKGSISVRVINAAGDVSSTKPAPSVEGMIKAIAPYLEYACIVKQLAHLSPENPPFKVDISVADNRRDFRIGEKIIYKVLCDEDCYLTLINVDSQGNIQVIFPNKYHADNFLKGGTSQEIPDRVMREKHFEFEFALAAGEETVKAIATNLPLTLEGVDLKDFQGAFKTMEGAALAETSPSRGLTNKIADALQQNSSRKDFRWSEDSIVVRSHN